MRTVITGGLGHVGSGLIKRALGEEIVIVDNLTTQAYPSLFNLPKICIFVNADILTTDLEEIFRGADSVIHLAAIADPENSYNQKEFVFKVNVEGTRRVAEACVNVGVPMVFASTTSVYGVQAEEVDEECKSLKPQTPYADSKIEAEKMLYEIEDLNYVVLRLGTIFGPTPGMRFHTAVNRFCFQAAFGKPITVWKTAMNQNRPYLSINDFVRAIEFIIYNKYYSMEIYNLVTINTTVGNIIEIIKEDVPDLKVNYVDSEIMSQLSYTISNEKFKGLRFDFTGDLKKGIHETLDLLKRK